MLALRSTPNLLDDVAPHFRDGDLQHHLVAAADDDRVDDLVGAADQPRRDIAGLLGLDRARYRAGQHDAVADALDLDARAGICFSAARTPLRSRLTAMS